MRQITEKQFLDCYDNRDPRRHVCLQIIGRMKEEHLDWVSTNDKVEFPGNGNAAWTYCHQDKIDIMFQVDSEGCCSALASEWDGKKRHFDHGGSALTIPEWVSMVAKFRFED